MAQLEGFNIADVSPVSKSIIDQTDNILDDEKEIATNYSNITLDSIKSDDSKTKDFDSYAFTTCAIDAGLSPAFSMRSIIVANWLSIYARFL